jgi:hypothetical protein
MISLCLLRRSDERDLARHDPERRADRRMASGSEGGSDGFPARDATDEFPTGSATATRFYAACHAFHHDVQPSGQLLDAQLLACHVFGTGTAAYAVLPAHVPGTASDVPATRHVLSTGDVSVSAHADNDGNLCDRALTLRESV